MSANSDLLEALSLSSDICAQEPIHIPGAIQPHALLVGLDAKIVVVRAVMRSAIRCPHPHKICCSLPSQEIHAPR